MKKLLLLLATAIMAVSCYDDSELRNMINDLQKSDKNIEAQLNAVEVSVTSLESFQKEIQNTIDILKEHETEYQLEIDALKEKDNNLENAINGLENEINDLKTLLSTEVADTKIWVESTFATLAQYNEIVDDMSDLNQFLTDSIVSLKTSISQNYEALLKEIGHCKTSIENWVNETLKSYYTSGHIDTLLDNQNKEFNESIKNLKTDLDDLSKKLDTLEQKVNELEAILKIFMREFSIKFDDIDIGIVAGGTSSVDYKIIGATDKTIVKAFVQGLWQVSVNQTTDSTGTITVQAPDPLIENEIVVIVYDGEYRTIMSSINFVDGVVAPTQEVIEMPEEGGEFELAIETNIEYEVIIPEFGSTWLSLKPATKSMRTDKLSFSVSENKRPYRISPIKLKANNGVILKEVIIIQKGTDTNNPAPNQILYKTSNDTLINLYFPHGFGANLIYNTYEYGMGILTFDGDVTNIGALSFGYRDKLISVSLPDSVKSIDNSAFIECSHLTSITLPEGLTRISESAFMGCSDLTSIMLPDSIKSIYEYAFAYCSDLISITLPEGLTRIWESAFMGCSDLTSITLPSTLTEIGYCAFIDCSKLKEVYCKSINAPNALERYRYHDYGKMFDNNAADRKIYVPMESVDTYKTTKGWSDYAEDIVGYDF